MSHRQSGCFDAGRKTEDAGGKHSSEMRTAGRTGVAGDPVEVKREWTGDSGKPKFSKECSRSKLKTQLAATITFKFLFGANKSVREGTFVNNADIKQQ